MTAILTTTDSSILVIARACVARFSPHTQRAYTSHITAYLAHAGPESYSLTREGISAWLSMKQSLGAGPVTLNVALSALKLLSREVWIRGLITGDTWNAINDIRAFKPIGKRLGQWTDEEGVERLIEACADSRERALIAILCGCGLRRSEIVSLKWEQYQEHYGRKVLVDIKGKGGKLRSVAVPQWAREIMDEYQFEEISEKVISEDSAG